MTLASRRLALIILPLAAGCASNRPSPARQAYADGADVARQEIARGEPILYGIGFGGGPPRDGATGLPVVWLNGCLPNNEKEQWVRGHNDYMVDKLKRPGLD